MTEGKKQGRERKVWVGVRVFYLSGDMGNTGGDADDSDNAGNPGNACGGGVPWLPWQQTQADPCGLGMTSLLDLEAGWL